MTKTRWQYEQSYKLAREIEKNRNQFARARDEDVRLIYQREIDVLVKLLLVIADSCILVSAFDTIAAKKYVFTGWINIGRKSEFKKMKRKMGIAS